MLKKSLKNNKPLISVITVVYNCENDIENTIKSVINQDFQDFEYIIIDGNSKDKTVSIINNYLDKIDYFISEKDKGIYDAMNKGILAANGKWLNFMNAGDTFYSSEVLKNVFGKNKSYDNKSIVFGYKFQNKKAVYPNELNILKKGVIMANHQSMFFNNDLLGNDLIYSLKHPIYGDYELVNRIFLKFGEKSFKYVNLPIAIFEGGGISSHKSYQKRKDKYLILFKHYGIISIFKSLFHSFTSGK